MFKSVWTSLKSYATKAAFVGVALAMTGAAHAEDLLALPVDFADTGVTGPVIVADLLTPALVICVVFVSYKWVKSMVKGAR